MKVEREAERLAMQAQRKLNALGLKLKKPLQLFAVIVVLVNKAVLVMSSATSAMATILPGTVLTE